MSRGWSDFWCWTVPAGVMTTGSCIRPTAARATENSQNLYRGPGVGAEQGLEVQWAV